MATILVVDDEETSLVLVQEMVASAGHEVVTARNGEEALEMLAQSSEIQAVITDLRMPRINGLRLIRDRREMGDAIPIIAVSGVNADQLLLAEDYGADAVLMKPLKRDELVRTLDELLTDTSSDWSKALIDPDAV